MIVLFVLIFLFFIEFFAYRAIQLLLANKSKTINIVVNVIYWFTTIANSILIVYLVLNKEKIGGSVSMNFSFVSITIIFMNVVSKTILALFHFLNESTAFIYKQLNKKTKTESTGDTISRSKFLTQTGAALATIPLGGLLYGLAIGRYNFRVLKETIYLKNLPDAFEGMRIVQLSDMHLGSFPLNTNAVAKGIAMVNELNADYILFTGDMVNLRAKEAEPWIETVGKLKAKYGKFATLGNHDYGSYYNPWKNKPDKIEQNIQHLQQIEAKMGFRLLRNENVKLTHNGQSIRLIGLENWGVGFVQSGDLTKAMKGVQDEEVKILMSHDPTHWTEQVIGKTDIDLSLAGHTHGSQIGVEIPALNIKYSPVQYRYEHWGGLYKEGEQQLYVNRGFGYHVFAGRIGMDPEITLLTLQKA